MTGPTPSSLAGTLPVVDEEPDGEHRYRGPNDGGTRKVVGGSQLPAQAVAPASTSFPQPLRPHDRCSPTTAR